jgi:hypothetical protein
MRKIEIVEMVWNFRDPKAPCQLQIKLDKITDSPWIDKITATFNAEITCSVHFDIESYASVIQPEIHQEIHLKLLCNLIGDWSIGSFKGEETKHLDVVHFRGQSKVPNMYAALDGLVSIVRALTGQDLSKLDRLRPFPKISKRIIIEDECGRMDYGRWLDNEYFNTQRKNPEERLCAAVGKLVRIEVPDMQSASGFGTNKWVGILGLRDGKGWFIEPTQDEYWPLRAIYKIDIFVE